MRTTLRKLLAATTVLAVLAQATVATADPLGAAYSAYDRGEYGQAAKLLVPLANQGNVDAQMHLGVMYAEGQGVLQDYAQSFLWFRRAADQGLSVAQNSVGTAYLVGKGIPPNNVLAHMWLNAASAQGNKLAMNALAVATDRMTPTEVGRAQSLARSCAKQGYQNCSSLR